MGNRFLQNTNYAKAKQNEFGADVSLPSFQTAIEWSPVGLAYKAGQAIGQNVGRKVANQFVQQNASQPMAAAAAAPEFVGPTMPSANANIMQANDGWATYFWNKSNQTIQYKSPSSGQIVVLQGGSPKYAHLSTAPLNWKKSNPNKMKKAHKGSAPQSQAQQVISNFNDDFPMETEPMGSGEEHAAVTHLKDNWMWYAGGFGAFTLAIIAAKLIPKGSGNTDEYWSFTIDKQAGQRPEVQFHQSPLRPTDLEMIEIMGSLPDGLYASEIEAVNAASQFIQNQWPEYAVP